jgi:hypothetical protein
MVNKNNLATQIKNKKPFEIVQEVNNKIPTYEEFLKTYNANEEVNESYNFELDSYKDIRVEKRSGPMPLYRDVAPFMAEFPPDRASAWFYQDNLFREKNGTVSKTLSLHGIDEMREALRKLEAGEL